MEEHKAPWYKHPFWVIVFQSLYITVFTDWFMGLAGRLTEIVLYFAVLYSAAQLYPGVQLPEKLSLWVFIVQMGALDIGGLSLVKMARQARKEGNQEGAVQAGNLSYALIGIMLVSVIVVGVQHVVSIPGLIQTIIQIGLVIARSICSVLYGRVIYMLKSESVQKPVHPEVSVPSTEEIVQQVIPHIEARFERVIERTVERVTISMEEQMLAQITHSMQAVVPPVHCTPEAVHPRQIENRQPKQLPQRTSAQCTPAQLEQIIQLSGEGLSVRKIAQQVGVSASTVQNKLKKG